MKLETYVLILIQLLFDSRLHPSNSLYAGMIDHGKYQAFVSV